MNLGLSTLRIVSITILCLLLLVQGVNLFRSIEANNWLYALIAATAIVVIGSYVRENLRN